MIILKNITKKFVTGNSSITAIDNINLEIKLGECVALIGHSGSGKSTLLDIIGGLNTPDEGDVKINNISLSDLTDKELSAYRNQKLGFIFQEFHLDPAYTVKENILLPTYFRKGLTRKDRKLLDKEADKLLEEVGLSPKKHAKIKELSGGQKQRTAIARALINKPKLILADEPTGNLDEKTGKTIIELLKEIHIKHKVTIIIATHDTAIAKRAEHVIKLKNGKLTQ